MNDSDQFPEDHRLEGPTCDCEKCSQMRDIIKNVYPHLADLDMYDYMTVLAWLYASMLSTYAGDVSSQLRIQLAFMQTTKRALQTQLDYVEQSTKRN